MNAGLKASTSEEITEDRVLSQDNNILTMS